MLIFSYTSTGELGYDGTQWDQENLSAYAKIYRTVVRPYPSSPVFCLTHDCMYVCIFIDCRIWYKMIRKHINKET